MMPHGYECDRCETFVEQPGQFSQEMHRDLNGAIEDVHVANPRCMSDDEGMGVEHYTLCDDCREALVRFVENDQLDTEDLVCPACEGTPLSIQFAGVGKPVEFTCHCGLIGTVDDLIEKETGGGV